VSDIRKRDEGMGTAELLDLPDDVRRLLRQIIRLGPVTVTELLAAEASGSPEALDSMLRWLLAQGYVAQEPGAVPPRFKAALRRAQRRPVAGLWDTVAGQLDQHDT
jgi:hypothetical protein